MPVTHVAYVSFVSVALWPPRGGGGGEDPLVGTEAHVPYPKGMEVGTVRGVHGNRVLLSGCSTQAAPPCLRWSDTSFSPTPEAAQEHLTRVR